MITMMLIFTNRPKGMDDIRKDLWKRNSLLDSAYKCMVCHS